MIKKLVISFLFIFTSLLSADDYANVVDVSASENDGAYNFSVSVKSPDISCKQYADWWEVLSENGKLIYRRILWHSHPNEQPVTRSGRVSVKENQVVYIRAHLNNRGYGGIVFKGSVATGFKQTSEQSFDKSIEFLKPLATECWY